MTQQYAYPPPQQQYAPPPQPYGMMPPQPQQQQQYMMPPGYGGGMMPPQQQQQYMMPPQQQQYMMPPGYTPPQQGRPPQYPQGMQRGWPQATPQGPQQQMKAQWDEKREKKLHKLYTEVNRDSNITPQEVQQVLSSFGYSLDAQQALQFLYTLDRNGDGKISWEEFRDGVKELISRFPHTGKPGKDGKKKDKKEKKDKKKK